MGIRAWGDEFREILYIYSMHKLIFSLLILCSTAITPVLASHPRLLFDSTDISALQQKMTREPFVQMLAVMEEEENNSAGDSRLTYAVGYQAVLKSFLSLLYTDADRCMEVQTLMDSTIQSGEWNDSGINGLRLYMHAKNMALSYDMCHWAFSDSLRNYYSEQILYHGITILIYGGTGQNTNPASNWQGNRYASAGLAFMATDETVPQSNLDTIWQHVFDYARENLGDSEYSAGWNIEGIGYTTYPWGNFIAPWMIAWNRMYGTDMRDYVSGSQYALWTVYAASMRIDPGNGEQPGLRPDFGDDNPHITGEGVWGQAFALSPDNLQASLKWWYNRIPGSLGYESYDRFRHGTLYSYLYYPQDISAEDPMHNESWKNLFLDTAGNGFVTARNAYRDSTDVISQLYLKLRGNKGHNGPDGLSFRTLGNGAPIAVGGGRYGTKINGQDAFLSSMNTVYPVFPEATLNISGYSSEVIAAGMSLDGSSWVVARTDTNNVGTYNHRRHWFTDFAPAEGLSAVIGIADSSENGRVWQMCTLESNNVQTKTGENGFLISQDGKLLADVSLWSENEDLTLIVAERERGSGYTFRDSVYQRNKCLQVSDGKHWLAIIRIPDSARGESLTAFSEISVTQNWPADSARIEWEGISYTFLPDSIVMHESASVSQLKNEDNRGKASESNQMDLNPSGSIQSEQGWDAKGARQKSLTPNEIHTPFFKK